jgi:WD40 repeat protein
MRPHAIRRSLLVLAAGIAGAAGTLRATSPDILWMRSGHSASVSAVQFLAGGALVSTSHDRTIKVWDPASGRLLETIATPFALSCAAVSDDGRWFVAGALDGTITVYDATSWTPVRTLVAHDGAVLSISLDAAATTISTSGESVIKLWRREDGALLRTLQGHTYDVASASLTPDGRYVVSASPDFSVRIWDARSGALLKTIAEVQYTALAVAVAPNGAFFAARGYSPTSDNRSINTYSIPDGRLLSSGNIGHVKAVTSIAISPDSRFLASTSTDLASAGILGPSVLIGDLQRTRAGFAYIDIEETTTSAFSPDGRYFAWGTDRGAIHVVPCSRDTSRIIDASVGPFGDEPITEFRGAVGALALTADGATIAAADTGTIAVLAAADGAVARRIAAHTFPIGDLAFDVDDTTLASASSDGSVKLWDATTGALRRVLYLSAEWAVSGVRFVDRGRRVAGSLGHGDSTIVLLDTTSNAFVATLAGHAGPVRAIATDADGERLVSVGDDGRILVWELPSGRIERSIEPQLGPLTKVAIARDGWIAAASASGALVLVEIESGAEIGRVERAHGSSITGVAFARDGSLLATSGRDSTVRIWERDVEGVHEAFVYRDYPCPHDAVALDVDRGIVVAGTDDATLIVRRLRTRCAAPSPLSRFIPRLLRDGDAATLVVDPSRPERVRATLVDIRGATVRTLIDERVDAAPIARRLDLTGLPCGSYIVSISCGAERAALQLSVIR